jgi:hypothetical protein
LLHHRLTRKNHRHFSNQENSLQIPRSAIIKSGLFLVLAAFFGLGGASGSDSAFPDSSAPAKKVLFSFGYDQRFRNEEWNNVQDQNSQSNDAKAWSIFRQRVWLNFTLGSPNIEFYVRMLNQFAKTSTPSIPLNWDEVIFDNLYVNFKKTFITGLSVKIGRQDLIFGEGFILMDGSAVDGPRTAYVNGIDISYTYRKSKLDLLGFMNPRRDRFLPIIHNQHRILNEPDEQLAGLYYTDRNHKNTDFDLYYLLKKEAHDYRSPSNIAFQPDRHVNTIGARIVHRMNGGFTATTEFALQEGRQHPDSEIRAWSAYGYLKKQFSRTWKPYLLGGYWALSGDDPSTGSYEGWDPLSGRWPKWSGMYPWSQVPEKGIGYWTNIKMAQAEAGFTPWKPVTVKGLLYVDQAFHPYPGNPAVFGNGTRRGLIPEIIASYAFGHSFVGEFRYEVLRPGDFYTGRTTGQFFRFEVNYSFKHQVER